LLRSTSTPTKAIDAPKEGPTEDREENPFYISTAMIAENDQLRSVKKRRVDKPLNVTFVLSPPSSPHPIHFAKVTQIKQGLTHIYSRITHYTSTPANHKLYEYAPKPPTVRELVATTGDCGIPDKVYQEVYYSKEADAPDNSKEYAGILFRIRGGTGLSALERWEAEEGPSISGLLKQQKVPLRLPRIVGVEGWEYNRYSPSRREIRSWLVDNPVPTERARRKTTYASQVNWRRSKTRYTPYRNADRRAYPSLVKQWVGSDSKKEGKIVRT
jgi:hypothetical protein